MPLPRTYVAVAQQYAVTEGAVRKHARAESWVERVAGGFVEDLGAAVERG